MVAPSSTLSFSQVAGRGRGTLCIRKDLKASVQSLSFAAGSSTSSSNSSNNTQIASGGLSLGSPARAVTSPHLIAIVGGAVGAVVVLAVILALVHVLRVRRKVERFRRSMNVLGPELIMPMPMSALRPPDSAASMVPVAASHVSPSTGGPLTSGTRHVSVRSTDYKRHSFLSDTPTLTPESPIRPPRRYPLPPGELTIDVGAARAFQPTCHLFAVSQTPMHSSYGVMAHSPGPACFPRYEPHSAVTLRATEH